MRKVEELEQAFKDAKGNKDRLEKEIVLTQKRLERAEKLTVGLASEHVRWKENVALLDDRLEKLVGDVFLSAGAISYYGPFSGTFRYFSFS